jgi:hypothetical protein
MANFWRELFSGLPDGIFSNQKSQFGYFLWACNGKGWYILWPFGLFYEYLVQFMAIWYICWLLGKFSTVLVIVTEKNMATLVGFGAWFTYSLVVPRDSDLFYKPGANLATFEFTATTPAF